MGGGGEWLRRSLHIPGLRRNQPQQKYRGKMLRLRCEDAFEHCLRLGQFSSFLQRGRVFHVPGDVRRFIRRISHSTAHEKFAASVTSPDPLYFATSGNGHKGRVIATPLVLSLETYFVAMIRAGATPFSTHCSSATTIPCSESPPPPACPN